MTKLSRIPRLLLLPALCLAACTADEPATLNADGQALVIEDLRIAGSNTRADAQPIEGSFVEGSRLQAKITTYNGQSSTGQYTYDNNNVWTSPAPAYWLTGGEQSVTLRTPYPDPIPAMPQAFNADNWHEYDILEYSGQTTPTTSFTLSHMRAQLCITLKAGAGLTDAELAGAKVTINKGTELWHHDNGAHYALLDPPALTIALDGETYTYTPGTDAPTLTAGKCLMLTLIVSKAQVSALDATSTGWQELTATGTEDTNVTILHCATPGTLSTTNNLDNLSGRVYVTGTINNTDLSALKGKLASITHLYIAAESGETGGLTVPTEFVGGGANPNTSLQAVAILHATSIGTAAFMTCTSLESIELPAITSIEDYAFGACRSLTSIALPAATSIENSTFDDCSSLESIELPAAETIGNKAFFNCTGLKSIDLPAAETIGDNAFEECSSLESIELPAATSIGNGAFNRCTNLKSIDLPAAETIGDNAFYSTNLKSIDLPAATSIEDNAFRDCASLTSIDLPEATSIGNRAFQNCTSLTNINLPQAETIRGQAFQDCTGLKSIDLPKATSIGYYAFNKCTNLKSIELPASTIIGYNAFQGCTNLGSINLPAATHISEYAFQSCDSLTSIDLPKATKIERDAFEGCTSLTSIDLPEATSIGNRAFQNCDSLESIAVPSTATTGSDVFSNSPTTTLFLTDEATTAADAGEKANWGGVTWRTIYYGYRGSGDYLESGSYEGPWTPSN